MAFLTFHFLTAATPTPGPIDAFSQPLSKRAYECSPHYGVGMNFNDCSNAFAKILPRLRDVGRFSHYNSDGRFRLPQSFRSDSGNCVIVFDMFYSRLEIVQDWYTTSRTARTMIDHCVDNVRMGGYGVSAGGIRTLVMNPRTAELGIRRAWEACSRPAKRARDDSDDAGIADCSSMMMNISTIEGVADSTTSTS